MKTEYEEKSTMRDKVAVLTALATLGAAAIVALPLVLVSALCPLRRKSMKG